MTHNFYEIARKQVESIFKKHNITDQSSNKINIDDDEQFMSFIENIEQYKLEKYEIQACYVYNAMLQTIAESLEPIRFTMEVL